MAYLPVVVDFLNDEGVGHEVDQAGDSVRFSFSGDTDTWMVFVHTLTAATHHVSGRVPPCPVKRWLYPWRNA